MITITAAQVGLVIGIVSLVSIIIGIVFWIQKPQAALEKRVQTLEDKVETNTNEFTEFKKTHDGSNEKLQEELKLNTGAINKLNLEMIRLSTIIEERIPKGQPNLTPPGQ